MRDNMDVDSDKSLQEELLEIITEHSEIQDIVAQKNQQVSGSLQLRDFEKVNEKAFNFLNLQIPVHISNTICLCSHLHFFKVIHEVFLICYQTFSYCLLGPLFDLF